MSRAFVKEGDDRPEQPIVVRRAPGAVPPAPPKKRGIAGMGTTVRVRGADGKRLTIRIVGEDDADPKSGALAWTSPFAQALMGHKTGDRVVVERPAGAAEYLVESVER